MIVTAVPEKVIFRSVTVYNKYVSSQCNLTAQIGMRKIKDNET